jgi:hypothetical protein
MNMQVRNDRQEVEFTPNAKILSGYVDLIYPVLISKYWYNSDRVKKDLVLRLLIAHVEKSWDQLHQVAMSSESVLQAAKDDPETIYKLAGELNIKIYTYLLISGINNTIRTSRLH